MKNIFKIKLSGGNDPEAFGEGSGGKAISGGDAGGGKYSCLVVIILLSLASCSIKKNKSDSAEGSKGVSVLSIDQMKDSDGDGIPDEIENKNGTNPFVADIPKISVSLVQDISIGAIFKLPSNLLADNRFSMLRQEFVETDSNKGGDLDLLKVLRRKVVKNQYNHLRNIKAEKTDVISNDDLRTNILSFWSDDSYYPFVDSLPSIDSINDNDSGKFVANFKVKIESASDVSEISDVSLKSFFYDYEKMEESEIYNHYLLKSSGSKERFKLSGKESFSPVTIYPLLANELKSNEIYSRLLDRSEIGIKFTDFNYTKAGIDLNYGQILNKVFDQDAKLIYSDGIKTEVFFISPSLTIAEALKSLGKAVVLNKDGDIYSINSIETTAKYPLDVDSLRVDDLTKGIWSVFGDADGLNDQMKPQGLYVVTYSTTKDILNASRKWTTVTTAPVVDGFKVDDIYEGDEIFLDVQSMSAISITESTSQSNHEHGNCAFSPDNSSDKRNGSCSWCEIVTATPVTVENPIQIPASSEIQNWFSFNDSYCEKVEAKVFKYKNKIKIKFSSLKSHLKNTIKISFKSPVNQTSSARSGTVSDSCGKPYYSNQRFYNQYKISASVSAFGINKY